MMLDGAFCTAYTLADGGDVMIKRKLTRLLIAVLILAMLLPSVAFAAELPISDQATTYEVEHEPDLEHGALIVLILFLHYNGTCSDYCLCRLPVGRLLTLDCISDWILALNCITDWPLDPEWLDHKGIFGSSPTMRNDRYMPSVHAILQSGNLYMFVMHNPVMWADPSGEVAIATGILKGLKYLAGAVGIIGVSESAGPQRQQPAPIQPPPKPRVPSVSQSAAGNQSANAASNSARAATLKGATPQSAASAGSQVTAPKGPTGPQPPRVPQPQPPNQRGIAGKGWRGDQTWRNDVSAVRSGGTIKDFNGRIPTQNEAIDLIREAGGIVTRIDMPHNPPNPHDFPHINFTTPCGTRGTIQIIP